MSVKIDGTSTAKEEQITIETIADIGAHETTIVTCPSEATAAQGDYITLTNAAGTAFAVWLDIDADGTEPTGAAYTAVSAPNRREVDIITGVAEESTVLCDVFADHGQGDYIVLTNAAGTKFAIWLDKDESEIEPTGASYLAVSVANRREVNIATGDDEIDVADKIEARLVALPMSGISVANDAAGLLTFTNTAEGAAANIERHNTGDTGTGAFVVATTAAGRTGDSAISVAAKITAALASSALSGIGVTDNLDGTITFRNSNWGTAADVARHNTGDTGNGSFALSQTVDGADSTLSATYFTISSGGVNYYVWLNVNNQSVDPAPASKTGIEVDIDAGDDADAIATALAAALEAHANFTASEVDDLVTCTNATSGVATDAADVDTTFTITKIIDGIVSTTSLDGEGKYDCTLTENAATGDYSLTYRENFGRAPIVVAVPMTADVICLVSESTLSGCRIKCFDATDGTSAKDSDLQILILGSEVADVL